MLIAYCVNVWHWKQNTPALVYCFPTHRSVCRPRCQSNQAGTARSTRELDILRVACVTWLLESRKQYDTLFPFALPAPRFSVLAAKRSRALPLFSPFTGLRTRIKRIILTVATMGANDDVNVNLPAAPSEFMEPGLPPPDAPPSPLRKSWGRKAKTFVFGDYDYRYLCMYARMCAFLNCPPLFVRKPYSSHTDPNGPIAARPSAPPPCFSPRMRKWPCW